MQPKASSWSVIRRIAGKEMTLFFASPIAYLFLACFVGVSLFVFFWGEAFFARNIADVRPLFEWMPLLLIFLASTLTMRLWSEERRTGTLEHILTQPVPLWHFVIGKFLGCMGLLAIALLITLPLPLTVAQIGDLDWGPVFAGYLASLLLGAAYLSIGLFVSARSENQIVSLITSVLVCGILYLLGTPVLTNLFGNQAGDWLRALGTGSRFDSITRGVIDFRDLYYYISIVIAFLALNTYVLERQRWARNVKSEHHTAWKTVTILLLANALCANLWLGQISSLRVDMTEGHQYSISQATKSYLARLREPLLIRGYFSSKTHPLLAPLVPQLRDLIKEYGVAGKGKVHVEFVDPQKDPQMEKEASQKYGIKPVPFQVSNRYQSSIVNSYFDVLVKYGDQHKVLTFRNLIEVNAASETNINVQLRNPEHDLTQAIKSVLDSYQAGGNLFNTVKGNLKFVGYVSGDGVLPQKLVKFKQAVNTVVKKYEKQADGQLSVKFVDPLANGGKVASQIAHDYGFQPMATSLLSRDRFYFYLTLQKDHQLVQIPLGDFSEASFERNFESAIKRFATGFTKTVALVTPAPASPYGYGGDQFSQLQQFLGNDLHVIRDNLNNGRVSGEADILLLMAPKNLNKTQLFAVDQFLMQGGTVIAATSPFKASLSTRSLSLRRYHSGLEDWLAHNGIKIKDKLVLDPQNAAFPVPVTRNIGGFQLRELKMLDYPYFPDIRSKGLNQHNPITRDLHQATLAWASPIVVDSKAQKVRTVTPLLYSSKGSWLSSSTDIMPRFSNGQPSYQPEGLQARRLLGVISQGSFKSYFAGKSSPLLSQDDQGKNGKKSGKASKKQQAVFSGVIGRSPKSARIIVFSSNDFLSDSVLSMSAAAQREKYLKTLQLMANTIDWSLEDPALLSIRSRGHFNRTLPPMKHETQLFWEYLNYGLAVVVLGLVAWYQRHRKAKRERQYIAQFVH